MLKNSLLLSICIPTNGNEKWVIPAIESIYSQKADNSLFEVIVTDNGEGNNLENAIKKYSYSNLIYRPTDALGFLNQINSFELAQGILIKFLNHRAKLLPGSLEYLIRLAKDYKETKPLIYLSDGTLQKNRMISLKTFDEFIYTLSYRSSWSAGFTMWKSDYDKLSNIQYNKMFPHLSIIFCFHSKRKYLIIDKKLQEMQDERGKGGYNLFQAFAVEYMDMNKQLGSKKVISLKTYKKIKKDLFYFLCGWYYLEVVRKPKYTFDMSEIKQHMNINYSNLDYYLMIFYSNFFLSVRGFGGRVLRKIQIIKNK
jgi:hypothetical protein